MIKNVLDGLNGGSGGAGGYGGIDGGIVGGSGAIGGKGITTKVTENGPEPLGILMLWLSAVHVAPFHPSPNESVIVREHEAPSDAVVLPP